MIMLMMMSLRLLHDDCCPSLGILDDRPGTSLKIDFPSSRLALDPSLLHHVLNSHHAGAFAVDVEVLIHCPSSQLVSPA